MTRTLLPLLAAIAALAQVGFAQETGRRTDRPSPAWGGLSARNLAADSTACHARAVRIAGTDTGAVVSSERARCLVGRGWRRVLRYDVDSGCAPIRVEFLDTVPNGAELAREVEQAVMAAWAPRARDRRVAARIAFTLHVEGGLARLDNARYVAGTDDGRRLLSAFTMLIVPRSGTRIGQRTLTTDAVAVLRGDCLAEVAAEEEREADVSTPRPDLTDQAYFEFQVEKSAAPMPGNAAPRHPDLLRSAAVEGEVLAQFVVDTAGRADMSTFKVLKSSHDLFTQAVRAALPEMRFYPAEIGGRKVRQVVQMPFQFALR